MKKSGSTIWRILFTLLFLCAAGVSLMAYNQFVNIKAERILDLSTWVPKEKIQHLMQYHGTDVMKITQDEVYIWRNSKWIPVLKRGQG